MIILSYSPMKSDGEGLATCLAVWTFSQVISMPTLQAQGRRFDPHCIYLQWCREWNMSGLLSLERYMQIHAHLRLVHMGQWGWCMISLSEWLQYEVFTGWGGLSYSPVTPYGKPLATLVKWLACPPCKHKVVGLIPPVARNATIYKSNTGT